MGKTFKHVYSNVYRARWKDAASFVAVDSVPDGLVWAPYKGPDTNFTVLRSIGDYYRLVRDRNTGAVVYFKRKHDDDKISPAETIDAEPQPPKQVRYRVGTQCWFVIDTRWYLVEVVERQAHPERITLRPVTGWDAERQTEWVFGELLQFGVTQNFRLFQHLRPLKARKL